MEFNISKCKVEHVGKINPKKPYYMREHILEVVDQGKDVGIIISSYLKSSSQQCPYAYNKANKVVGVIRRTIINKKVRIIISLYKILGRPHVEYCSSAWSPLHK